MDSNSPMIGLIVGLAVVGAAITGVMAFFIALVAVLLGEVTGAGLCLIAAAFAFGFLANAVFRR